MAVVQPGSVSELQAIVAACAVADVAVVPRGGGASYSGGYTINTPASITLDMSQLNRILNPGALGLPSPQSGGDS